MREYGGKWGVLEKDLLIRLIERRGWPIDENKVRERLLLVATDIAENKGGSIDKLESDKKVLRYEIKPVINRIRMKMKDSEDFLKKEK